MVRYRLGVLALVTLSAMLCAGCEKDRPLTSRADEPGVAATSKAAEPGVATTSKPDGPGVVHVGGDDPEMNKAMQRARDSIAEYIIRLQTPPPTQSYLGLKARFEEGDRVEHIWISGVQYKNKMFVGTVGNEPVDVTSVRFGDPVTVPVERVSDWMAVDSGRLVGGYTLRLLRKRMSPEERAEFDSSTGFRIE